MWILNLFEAAILEALKQQTKLKGQGVLIKPQPLSVNECQSDN
jgi:hypothetical protein